MDNKRKFRLADKNKPGIDRMATQLLAIFNCDREALMAEVKKYQEEKCQLIKDQHFADAAELRDKEKTALNILGTVDHIDTVKDVYDVLEDCIFFEYAPNDIRLLCAKMVEIKDDIKSTGKKPKDMGSYERKVIQTAGLANSILEFTPYKFFFLGGAMAEHRTLFARDHKEAWNKANAYCVESFAGNIRGILCLTKDGEDIGTLKNMEAMFAPIPEDPKEVRGVRATDLVPEYQDYK